MKLSQVREEHAYFTTETGTRCRAISYGGIGAVWALKGSAYSLNLPLTLSLTFFITFLLLDVIFPFLHARKAEKLIRYHEIKVYKETNSLPGPEYSFNHDPKDNALSRQAFMFRPILAGLGYLPLIVHLWFN